LNLRISFIYRARPWSVRRRVRERRVLPRKNKVFPSAPLLSSPAVFLSSFLPSFLPSYLPTFLPSFLPSFFPDSFCFLPSFPFPLLSLTFFFLPSVLPSSVRPSFRQFVPSFTSFLPAFLHFPPPPPFLPSFLPPCLLLPSFRFLHCIS
jgi:hypothetical protein